MAAIAPNDRALGAGAIGVLVEASRLVSSRRSIQIV